MFAVIDVKLDETLERLTYAEAMRRFGKDAGPSFWDGSPALATVGFVELVFQLDGDRMVWSRPLALPGAAERSRKQIESLQDVLPVPRGWRGRRSTPGKRVDLRPVRAGGDHRAPSAQEADLIAVRGTRAGHQRGARESAVALGR